MALNFFIDTISPETLPERFATSATFKAWLSTVPVGLRADAMARASASLREIDDPISASRLLLEMASFEPARSMTEIVALTYQALGRTTLLEAAVQLLSEESLDVIPNGAPEEYLEASSRPGKRAGAHLRIPVATEVVRSLIRYGLLTWQEPEGQPLRDRLLELKVGYAYIGAPDLTEDALVTIWKSSDGAGLDIRPLAYHPQATVEFWTKIVESRPQDFVSRRAWDAALSSARARQQPEIRRILLTNISNFRKTLTDLAELASTTDMSDEALAFILEGHYRLAAANEGWNPPLQKLLKALTRRKRLRPGVPAWLSASDVGAVRQWAQLTVVPLTSDLPASHSPTPPDQESASKGASKGAPKNNSPKQA